MQIIDSSGTDVRKGGGKGGGHRPDNFFRFISTATVYNRKFYIQLVCINVMSSKSRLQLTLDKRCIEWLKSEHVNISSFINAIILQKMGRVSTAKVYDVNTILEVPKRI